MPTAAELLTEMQPAWRAALGDRVSPKYLDAFIGRHQRRLEAELEPIAVALAAVPPVSVYELAEDVARRLRGSSEIANVLANTPHNFGGELDRQLPKVMLEYLPTIAGGQTQGADTPNNLAIYRRWSDDADFRRKLREQVRELLWERRPGWNSKSSSNEAELEEKKAEQESEARTRLRSTQLRNAAAKLAERRVKVAADSIALLRRQDVERVLRETPSAERRQVAYVLGERRPELVDEIDEVMREVLSEPANWSTYGRDEIYQPGSRAKREALAESDRIAALERSAEVPATTGRDVMIRPDGEVGYFVGGQWRNIGFVAYEGGMYWPRSGTNDPIVDPFGEPIHEGSQRDAVERLLRRGGFEYGSTDKVMPSSAPIWRSSEAVVVSEFEVDGTKCTIFDRPPGYHVRVTDGGLEVWLDTLDGSDLRAQAESHLESVLNPRPAVALIDQELHDLIQARQKRAAERVVHAFTLAAQRISESGPSNKAVPSRDPTPAESAELERALDAADPMIDEAERELAALEAEDGKPRPVVMASLEAGGIILLTLHTHIGGKGSRMFQTYLDDTSRLQYVSYPKKGNRGIPTKVAKAILALERDGFEVRAANPEVIGSLIEIGGLDHALASGPPPPRDAAARPSNRTSDPSLIARVSAMAADPPTSTIKYLVKSLRLNGDLPLQVIDWKNGGKRSLESAIEEGEGKVARKLARRPKAERLRDDGGERPAKDANEEHAAQALVQLADMDPDKAREINDAGFSKSDVATGHALARRWEASGQLTGDEWAWAVDAANKYRRQVGPLPEPKGKAKRQRSKDSDMSVDERLFIGVTPTGIVYADRSREVDGDYARCAFLPFDTLALDVSPKCPEELRGPIRADAATIIARRGEKFAISASDQTVVLGSKSSDDADADQPPSPKGTRAMAQRIVNAEDGFIETIQERGFTREEAVKAMATMLRTKVAALDPVGGTIRVKHGAFLDPEVIRNAVDAWVAPTSTKQTNKRERAPSTSDMNYAGNSLLTIQDVVASLKRNLGKIYEGYKLNIGVLRAIGDNSVMLSFYRVPPDASDLDASNAKSKVRVVIRGEGRTNGPTWPTDQTPARLTASTVWEHNAPKFRKRSGPPSVIVAAVASWFVLNSATLMSGEGPVSFHYIECPKCESSFRVPQSVTAVPAHKCWAQEKEDARSGRHDERGEEERMGAALRGARDVEEAQWERDVERGTRAEMRYHGLGLEEARKAAVANLGQDARYYEKMNEEKWGYRP
jgi:hypothetical protein